MNWYFLALSKYADFRTRSQRKELWYFWLFSVIVFFVLDFVGNQFTDTDYIGMSPFGALYGVAILIPTWAVCARRLHDIGRTGWWQLIGLIPVVGAIVLIVFYSKDSDSGTNEYGPNPKAEDELTDGHNSWAADERQLSAEMQQLKAAREKKEKLATQEQNRKVAQSAKPDQSAVEADQNSVGERDIDQINETDLDDSELEFYEQAWKEANNESHRDEGIWSKAYSETGGVEQTTRALYIKLRVPQFKRHREEAERKAEVQARRKVEETEENALIAKLKEHYKGSTSDINEFINSRESKLSKAVSRTEEENVLTCLAGGADPRLRDVHDEKPIEIAQKYLHQSRRGTRTYQSIITILTVAERLWDKGILTDQGIQNIRGWGATLNFVEELRKPTPPRGKR